MEQPVVGETCRTDERRRDRDRGLGFSSIVHINEKGGSFGGTEEYIALVTAALGARGVRSHLVCGVVSGELPATLASVTVVDGLTARQPQPATGPALVDVIAHIDADVIYLHNVFDPAAVASVAALSGRGVLIWYVHDHYLTCLSELRWRRDIGSCPHRLGQVCLAAIGAGHCVLRNPGRTVDDSDLGVRATLSRSLGAADATVVVSDYMRALLHEAEPDLGARLHRVTRPIRNLGELRERRRQRPDEPSVIAYAGRVTAEKGLAVLIEALGSITSRSMVELRVAGVIEDAAYWSHCHDVQLDAMATNPCLRVSYLGHLDYDHTDEQFRQADIVVVPSQWPEPLGAVALEAMSAGAAVVASRVGGLDDSIVNDHNGLHVDPGDVGALAAAVDALLGDPQYARRLGHQAHQDVAGVAVDEHLEDLDRLISAHRPHAAAPTTSAPPDPR